MGFESYQEIHDILLALDTQASVSLDLAVQRAVDMEWGRRSIIRSEGIRVEIEAAMKEQYLKEIRTAIHLVSGNRLRCLDVAHRLATDPDYGVVLGSAMVLAVAEAEC